MSLNLLWGECVERMSRMQEGSVGGVVCDPPYGLEFMGKDWDTSLKSLDETSPTCTRCGGKLQGGNRCRCGGLQARQALAVQVWHQHWVNEVYRVLVPGGAVKVFGGTKIFHRLAAALTSVGFVDLRMEAWVYLSGYPKSVDVGKLLDRRGGATSNSREAFSKHLVERRLAKGLSRMDVSVAVVGKRTGSCWNWENFSLPEPRFWPALRDLLDLDPAWEPLIMGTELDLDYLGEPFGPVPRLLAVADTVTKVTAVCMKCGADATRSQRLTASPEQVLVGAKDTYEARCRGCWSPHHG